MINLSRKIRKNSRLEHPVSGQVEALTSRSRFALERRVAAAKRCHKVNRMHNLDIGNYCTYVRKYLSLEDRTTPVSFELQRP